MSSNRGQCELLLVDAYSLIFQVFYAIRGMSSPKGLPTNALFGFTRDMLYLHEERKPDYLICVFDEGEPRFRTELLPEYKANRAAMPEELLLQMPAIEELLEAMNIPRVSCPGYEADDVIATLAVAGAERGCDVVICTSDKDCRQLISDRVRLLNLRKNTFLDREALLKEWGIRPEQVVDLLALVGDAVDNIQGVPGIGLKTAAKLLQDYGDIDNLLAHVDEISGDKRRENLKASAALLQRNRQLLRLNTKVPLKLDWEAWRWRPMNVPRLLKLFREWGFHRFAEQVKAAAASADPPAEATATPPAERNGFLFDDTAEIVALPAEAAFPSPAPLPPATWQATYQLVDQPEDFRKLMTNLCKQHRFAIDLETTSEDPVSAEIVGYAICYQPGEASYLPVRGPADARLLDGEQVKEALRPLLEDPAIQKINQNIKYDAIVLRQHGVQLRGIAGDSMVAEYLLNAGERLRNLATLSRTYLQHEVIPIEDLIGKKGPAQKRMDQVPPAKVAEYAGEDADVAWRLCDLLEQRLEQEQLKPLYDELEVPLIEVLAELQHNGIRIDVAFLETLGAQLEQRLKEIEARIYEIAGEEFNINSLKHLRRVMFDKLKLPVKRKTGITGEASTDQATLEWLAAQQHELPQQLLEHRRISKLKGTYIDTLPRLVNPRTGRVHTSFNQTVAATGRLSSSDPNLQNIPIRSELGGQIRQAFVPEPGWLLVTADYSQVELRLLAHFSGDAELRRAFHEDRDIHALVASQIYGVAEDAVTADMRRMAKTVNFGVIYGMSAFGLAQRLQIPNHEAESFIDAYFARYPRVLEYQQNLLSRCREQGYVSTILGRRRAFQRDVIRPDSTYKQRTPAEREAINMEIQGSAADLIKVAMLAIFRRLRAERRRARMLLQIHDELVFETPPEELADVARLIEEEMTQALADRLEVPLKVDLGAGTNWLEVADPKAYA